MLDWRAGGGPVRHPPTTCIPVAASAQKAEERSKLEEVEVTEVQRQAKLVEQGLRESMRAKATAPLPAVAATPQAPEGVPQAAQAAPLAAQAAPLAAAVATPQAAQAAEAAAVQAVPVTEPADQAPVASTSTAPASVPTTSSSTLPAATPSSSPADPASSGGASTSSPLPYTVLSEAPGQQVYEPTLQAPASRSSGPASTEAAHDDGNGAGALGPAAEGPEESAASAEAQQQRLAAFVGGVMSSNKQALGALKDMKKSA